MKRLTTYLNERLVVNQRFEEKLIVNKNYKGYTPVSFNELRKIIKQRYKEQGPGTKQNPIDFNDIDVSNIDSFCNEKKLGIFEGTEFEYIDISNWNISRVENIRAMFWQCTNLKSVGDLSKWDISKVKDMSYMFYECMQLEYVGDLSNWDVSNVKDMNRMFFRCKNLVSIGDLSKWDVSMINDVGMFHKSGITNIPNWYKG